MDRAALQAAADAANHAANAARDDASLSMAPADVQRMVEVQRIAEEASHALHRFDAAQRLREAKRTFGEAVAFALAEVPPPFGEPPHMIDAEGGYLLNHSLVRKARGELDAAREALSTVRGAS